MRLKKTIKEDLWDDTKSAFYRYCQEIVSLILWVSKMLDTPSSI